MTSVYRHYDAAGRILYIGISSAVSWRLMAHEKNAPWWRDVRRVEISEPYATHAAALLAEAEAIRTERPKWNRQHTDDPSQPRLGAFVIADPFEADRARSLRRAST